MEAGKGVCGIKCVPLFTFLPNCNCEWTEPATLPGKGMVTLGEDGLDPAVRVSIGGMRVNGGGENEHQHGP